MNAFAAGINAIFRDPNMSKSVLYRAGGEGVGLPVRVIFRAPDRVANFGEGRFVTDTLFLDVRVSEVPDLQAGDTFQIGMLPGGTVLSLDFSGDQYLATELELLEVRSDPVRDRERLVWAAEVRAA